LRKINFGIVGATGFVAIAHANGLLSNENANIVALCGRNAEVLRSRGDNWGVKKLYTDYNDLLRDEEVDVVDILTPPFLHKEMTVLAAEAGKHVIVEKPMCRSIQEANEMITAARKNGVKLMVAESYVFTTTHIKARELIDEGMIGEPMQIRQSKGVWLRRRRFERRPSRSKPASEGEIHWRVHPEKSGGGDYPWFMDHAVHFFALARYLMKETAIRKIFAMSRSVSTEYRGRKVSYKSVPLVTWEYEGQGKYGMWSRVDQSVPAFDHLGFRTVVNGTDGVIEVLGEGGGVATSGYTHPSLILHTKGKTTNFRIDEGPDRVWVSEVNYYDQAHTNELNHFIQCLLEDREPRYTGENGKKDIQYTLAAIKSAIEGNPVNPDSVPEDWAAYKIQHR